MFLGSDRNLIPRNSAILRCKQRLAISLALRCLSWIPPLVPDLPHEDYQPHPPWDSPPILTTYTRLPDSKANCPMAMQKQLALRGMEQLYTPGTKVYYTDGSVDSDRGRAGAAYVSGALAHGWRTSDNCSSLQAELAAIHGALRHFQDTGSQRIVVHTDSRAALQVLSRSHHPDNIALVTSILAMANNIKQRGGTIVINWIPSHVGLQGNERADTTAKNASNDPQVQQHIRESLSQTRATARRRVWNLQETKRRDQIPTSRSMAWHATATEDSAIHPSLRATRKTEAAIHRLRLGYRTAGEIIQDRNIEPCQHCSVFSPEPLIHYILQCPRTRSLRPPPLPPGNEARSAASLIRQACLTPEILTRLLQDAPPPR